MHLKLKLTFLIIIFVSSVKCVDMKNYSHITECYHYNSPSTNGRDNITFFCNQENNENRIFHQDYLRCSNGEYDIFRYWIGQIEFKRCQFHEIRDEFFARYWNFHTLLISDVEQKSLWLHKSNENTDSIWKSFTKLIVSNNRFDEVSFKFINSTGLKNVQLTNNSIKTVDPHAFISAINIESLDLSHNNLAILDEVVFKVLVSLTNLNLSHNSLVDIPDNLLMNTKKLTSLDLSNNQIKQITQNFFKTTKKLKFLDISSNVMTNLITLNLSHNHLRDIPNLDLPYLQSLRMASNQLSTLNFFQTSHLPELKMLDIRNNSFNCSYLRHLFISNYVHLDISTIDLNEPHVSGIKCIQNIENSGHYNETKMETKIGDNEIKAISPLQSIDHVNIFIRVIFICIIVLLLSAIILIWKRICHRSCCSRNQTEEVDKRKEAVVQYRVNLGELFK